jgi:hypothetical protein
METRMITQHILHYFVDSDGSVDNISIETQENGKIVQRENIDYYDLVGLNVGIERFLSETKKFKGKIFLKKKAFDKFTKEQEK